MTDPTVKGREVIAFMGLKPGDKIADIFGGRIDGAFAQAVGPTGKVYSVVPAELVKAEKQGQAALDSLKGLAASPIGGNIVVSSPGLAAMGLPANSLDEVFIRQNYHDLYDPFLGPADVPNFDKEVFAALKPGGEFIILDHLALAGSGLAPDQHHPPDRRRAGEGRHEGGGFRAGRGKQDLRQP